MSTLAALLAAPLVRTIDGRPYELAPLSISDWLLVEERIRAERPDPLALAQAHLDGLSPEAQRALLESALLESLRRTEVSVAEIKAFFRTPAGLGMAIWLALRKAHPELSEADGLELAGKLVEADLDEVARLAGGDVGRDGNPAKN